MRGLLICLACLLGGVLWSMVAWSGEAMPHRTKTPLATPQSSTPAASQSVTQLVGSVCSACHAQDGNSLMTTDPKLAGQHASYLLKQLKEFKSGVRANPVMAGMVANLSTEDMSQLAAYFSKQTPSAGQAKSNGVGSLGEKIYRAGVSSTAVPACAACHGARGSGLPNQFPRLAGQHADYTLAQLMAFRAGTRTNAPMMMLIASRMSDNEMKAVADYIQGLH